MSAIAVNVIVKTAAVGSELNLLINVPLNNDESQRLLQVKDFCSQVVRVPNTVISSTTVNGLNNYNDDDLIYHNDEVVMILSNFSPSPTATTCSSTSNPSTTTQPVTGNEANHSSPPTALASMPGVASSTTSTAYTAVLSSFTAFNFTESTDFVEWQNQNLIQIRDCYTSCIAQKGITYNDIDLYTYFNAFPQMSTIVLYGYRLSNVDEHGQADLIALQNAEDRLLKVLAEFIHHAHPTYDVYTHGINQFLGKMYEWLHFNVFQTWMNLKSANRLQIIIKKRRNYRSPAAAKKRALSTFTAANEDALNRLAVSLSRAETTEAAEAQLRSTVFLRRSWVNHLNNDPSMEKGVATVFFKKLPIYTANLDLLHLDYVIVMQDLFKQVPDLANTLKLYAPTIIYTALVYSVEVLPNEMDICFKALHALPALVKQFVPRGQQQSFKHLYTETDNLNINTAQAKRMTLTTCPSIVATNWGNKKTYFVAVDDFTLHSTSTDFAQAMQRLFEVYYVLDLAYDNHMKDFFHVLESLMEMKVNVGVGVSKLVQTLKQYCGKPPPNFTELLASASVAGTEESSQDTDPFATVRLTLTDDEDSNLLNYTTEGNEEEENGQEVLENDAAEEIAAYKETQPTATTESFMVSHTDTASHPQPSCQPTTPRGRGGHRTSLGQKRLSQHRSTAASQQPQSSSTTFAALTGRISTPTTRGLSNPAAKRLRGRPSKKV